MFFGGVGVQKLFSAGRRGNGEANAGFDLYQFNDSFLSGCARVCARLREAAIGGERVSFESVLGLIASALLLVYLTYALLRPEKF